MAAGGYKEFVAGEILDEDDINDFLMQGVLVFAGTAARGSAIGTAVEGQFAFLKDTDTLTYYSGSAWEELSTQTPYATISDTPTGSYNDGSFDWDYYVFKSSGTVTVSASGLIDFLVVAGGASGARFVVPEYAGGGGAGGCLVPVSGQTIAAGTYTVTVGGGGAIAGSTTAVGLTGNDSSIGSAIVARGGGAGASRYINGGPGGSGGGAGQGVTGLVDNNANPKPMANGQSGGFGIPGQGFNGENSRLDPAAGGGGGGEAGGTQGAGRGGNGLISTIISTTIATAQSVGEVSGSNVYYAGGGAGGNDTGAIAGGLGGGADGSSVDGGAGGSGVANTGGGGGGGEASGGAGGSGVVIIRTRTS
jgi:hypothetical protein